MSGGAPLTPGERRRRDSVRGRRAYDALLARFEREVDPDRTLPPDERARRAEEARQAHFRALGRRGGAASARSRQPQRPASDEPTPSPSRRRSDGQLKPADWVHLWEQPEMRTLLSDRDVAAAYRALQDLGVTQRQIAQLTAQSQSDISTILDGRQVRDVAVLERICRGLAIPRPYMRLLDKTPSENGAYSDKATVANPLDGVSPEMLRRHLIALGGIIMAGVPVAKLGELLTGLGDPPLVPLPSQLSQTHVAQVRDMTRRLGMGDACCADPQLASSVAALATRLLGVPGSAQVTQAMQVAVAELRLEAAWAAFDAGLYQHALYHFARALELARQAGDAYCQSLALGQAGLASVEHGQPNDGLKMLQCAQVAAWAIPADDRRAVVVGVSGKAAVQAVQLADSALALAVLGEHTEAARALARGRDLWTPTPADPFGDLDRDAARLELARGRLDVAEAMAVASMRRWTGGRQLSRTMSGIVLATIHVKAGERDGLQLAHDTITSVTTISSVRTRKRLLPLADALQAHPDPDAKDLACQTARLAGNPRAW